MENIKWNCELETVPPKNDIQIVNNSGQLVKDPKKVGNLINEYFVSVGEELSKNINPPVNTNLDYLTGVNKVDETIFLKLISPYEMENYIKKLDINKSTTSISPPTKFIKLYKNYLSNSNK